MTRDQAIKILEDRIQAAEDSRQADIPLPWQWAAAIAEILKEDRQLLTNNIK